MKIMSGLSQTRTGTAGRSGLCLRAEFGRDALEGVADGVDGMVVSVRVAADPLAGAGLFILIGAELFIRFGRAVFIDDDGAALEPLHPVFHAAGPLDGLLRPDAETAVVGNGFRLGRVAGGEHVVVAVIENPAGGLLVIEFVADMLIQQIDDLPIAVVMETDKGVEIREPAPVHPLKNPVEGPDFFIGDGAQLEILKHAAAGADGNAQILVLIAAHIPLFQRLGLLERPSPCD